MSTLRRPRNVLLIVALGFVAACTSTGPVEDVASRAIDRAHTLPDGVATWKTVAITGKVSSGNKSITSPPVPLPIFWEQAIGENFTLEWSPVPFSFRYQISKTDTQMWGLNFGMGMAYSTGQGFIFAPSAKVISRTKFADNFALQSAVGSNLIFGTGEDFESGYSADLSLSPMFQLSDSFALNPTVGLGLAKSGFSAGAVGFSSTSTKTVRIFPLGGGFDWHFARQWALDGSYYSVKGGDEFKANLAMFSLRHYW